MKGGKLSTSDFKGLLDASYDPSIKNVGGFILDKPLSSSTSKVYRNPETGQVVVAHRGTEGISDWGNNAIYALGGKNAYKLTPRYKEAEKVQKRAEKKYGASNVSTIGHSQGGLQSELLGGKSKEIITLNKATLPFESNKNKNQFDIRSDRDVVSGLNPFAKKSKKDISIKAQSYNPLTEHSGDVLKRLDKKRMIGQGPRRASAAAASAAGPDEEVYGSFDNDAGERLTSGERRTAEQYIGELLAGEPTTTAQFRRLIEQIEPNRVGRYFIIRRLKDRLFDILLREGMVAREDYYNFMANFMPSGPNTPESTLTTTQSRTAQPSSAESNSSRRSDGSDAGMPFKMELDDEDTKGTGIMRRRRIYMKGFGRMRGGVVVTPPPSPPPPPEGNEGVFNPFSIEAAMLPLEPGQVEDIYSLCYQLIRRYPNDAEINSFYQRIRNILTHYPYRAFAQGIIAILRAFVDNVIPIMPLTLWAGGFFRMY